MGITDLLPALGFKIASQEVITVLGQGKTAAVEVQGLARAVVMGVAGVDMDRHKEIAEHVNAGGPLSEELVAQMASRLEKVLLQYLDVFSVMWYVFEGIHPLKKPESERRAALRKSAMDDGEYNKALTVPDCAISLVLRRLEDRKDPSDQHRACSR